MQPLPPLLSVSNQEVDLDDKTDQFITRHGKSIDAPLLTELVIRLSNDFPTTEREASEFEVIPNPSEAEPHSIPTDCLLFVLVFELKC